MRESIPTTASQPVAIAAEAFRPEPARPATNLAALIAEAEHLHHVLGETRLGLARLIAGLRRHRKQTRLVDDTLRSLRQLKLAEAAD